MRRDKDSSASGKKPPTKKDGEGKGPTGNDRGTGPATLVSPEFPAIKSDEQPERHSDAFVRSAPTAITTPEPTKDPLPPSGEEEIEEGAGMERDIEDEFRRRLAGLRRLPRAARPHALQLAREWRQLALNGLRDKRAGARHARRALRRLRTLALG
jgi:hypothetical protein